MTQLEKLQKLELVIAKEIKRICEKNHIPYFLFYGSLLGAVRHGGFIPWDDDIDIGMYREHFDKFIDACKKDLGDAFFLQTWDIDPEYPFAHAKVRLNGTHITESFAGSNKPLHDGVFVDIFPFDNLPDNPKQEKQQAILYTVCSRMMWIKKGMGEELLNGSFSQRIKYHLAHFFGIFINFNMLKNYYRRNLVKYNEQETNRVVAVDTQVFHKNVFNKEWIDNLEAIQFEDAYFLVPKNKEAMLSRLYGDWKKLPPEDKRGGHAITYADFGEYCK